MIECFQEHAANERKFLSWTRTAVTVAGFGILIEKFPYTARAAWTGVALVGLSTLLVLFSTIRFPAIRRQLNRQHADGRLFTSMLALFLVTLFVFQLRLAQ